MSNGIKTSDILSEVTDLLSSDHPIDIDQAIRLNMKMFVMVNNSLIELDNMGKTNRTRIEGLETWISADNTRHVDHNKSVMERVEKISCDVTQLLEQQDTLDDWKDKFVLQCNARHEQTERIQKLRQKYDAERAVTWPSLFKDWLMPIVIPIITSIVTALIILKAGLGK